MFTFTTLLPAARSPHHYLCPADEANPCTCARLVQDLDMCKDFTHVLLRCHPLEYLRCSLLTNELT